jgi:hypothetical protein
VSPYYHITIDGHLEAHWSAWFDGLSIANLANGSTLLAGPLVDQAALFGVLIKIRDLGLPLIAVQPMAPNEQVDVIQGDNPDSRRST